VLASLDFLVFYVRPTSMNALPTLAKTAQPALIFSTASPALVLWVIRVRSVKRTSMNALPTRVRMEPLVLML
jgi:hypothetical protein